MDIYGLGVFIRGESGIGKSEAALGLVVRDHRLVADIAEGYDVVVMGADKWHQIQELQWYDDEADRDATLARLPEVAVALRPPLIVPPELLLDGGLQELIGHRQTGLIAVERHELDSHPFPGQLQLAVEIIDKGPRRQHLKASAGRRRRGVLLRESDHRATRLRVLGGILGLWPALASFPVRSIRPLPLM